MKTMHGIITSLKNTSTATVTVTNRWQHPLYKKFVKRSKNYACHYENMQVAEGDAVVIESSRPISKTKHFRIIEKVETQS